MLYGLVLCVALAAPSSEEVLRQQDVVEEAAAAVAQARAQGARRREVADLMAAYRTQAEALAAMAPPVDLRADVEVRQAAVAALAEATAQGREDAAARDLVDTWLGPLEPRLGLLEGALASAAAVRSPGLAQSMVADVVTQCTAVMVAAAHDATLADEAARRARLRAAALRAGEQAGQGGGVAAEVDLRAAEAAAEEASLRAAALWGLRDRAHDLRERAREVGG